MVGKILARLRQVNALGTKLVAVEDDFGLGLVKLQIGVGENKTSRWQTPSPRAVSRMRPAAWVPWPT